MVSSIPHAQYNADQVDFPSKRSCLHLFVCIHMLPWVFVRYSTSHFWKTRDQTEVGPLSSLCVTGADTMILSMPSLHEFARHIWESGSSLKWTRNKSSLLFCWKWEGRRMTLFLTPTNVKSIKLKLLLYWQCSLFVFCLFTLFLFFNFEKHFFIVNLSNDYGVSMFLDLCIG